MIDPKQLSDSERSEYEFLLRRGYCCESGCKLCPYGFKEQAEQLDVWEGEVPPDLELD